MMFIPEERVVREMAEESITPPFPDPVNETLRLLARMLAAGYLRLRTSCRDRRPTADSASIREKSLDLSVEQSDELAMSDRRRRRRA